MSTVERLKFELRWSKERVRLLMRQKNELKKFNAELIREIGKLERRLRKVIK